jgi:hypothetical protein
MAPDAEMFLGAAACGEVVAMLQTTLSTLVLAI